MMQNAQNAPQAPLQSVVRARSETEAAWMVAEGREGTRLIAGGTDLMLQMAHGRKSVAHLVDIRRAGMNHIRHSGEGFHIGACVTAAEISANLELQEHAASLWEAAGTLSVPQIRNLATLGGNMANASPAADMVPCVLAMDGSVRIKCGDDVREVKATDLATGPGRTCLNANELLVEIFLPSWSSGAFHHFVKMGFRDAQVIALCSMALSIEFHGDEVARVGIAWGSVAAKVVRSENVERFLLGKKLTRDVVEEAKRLLEKDIHPIDDHRSEAAYRRKVCTNFLVDGLLRAHFHSEGVHAQTLKSTAKKSLSSETLAALRDPSARPSGIIDEVRTQPLTILGAKPGPNLIVQPTSPSAYRERPKTVKKTSVKKTSVKSKPRKKTDAS